MCFLSPRCFRLRTRVRGRVFARQLAVVLASVFVGAGLLVAPSAVAATKPADYSSQPWHVRDGLPNDEVNQIAQDEAGYLWIATTGGLARFDGVNFKILPRSLGAATDTFAIATLTPTRGFGVVVGFTTGGVAVLRDGEFVPAPFAEAIGSRSVIASLAEADGTVWIGCADGLVFRCGKDGVQNFTVPRGLPGPRQIGFALDGQQRVWVASDLNLLRYDGAQLVAQHQPFEGVELRIASSRDAGPWVVTTDRLLRGTAEGFVEVATIPVLAGAHYVQAMHQDRAGNLWLGTRSRGLQRFADGALHPMPKTSEDIFALCEDTDGNLWVGSNGAGLTRLRAKHYELLNKSSGLLLDFSPTVCADSDGRMWLANRDGGTVEMSATGARTHGPLPDWPSYSAVSVFPHPDGGIGFTCGSGAYRIKAPGAPIERILSVPTNPIIRTTLTTRNGDTWMAIEPHGLGRLRKDEFTHFGVADGLPEAEIRALAEMHDGALLIGTVTGELWRHDARGFRLVPLTTGTRKHGAIQCLHVDDENHLWLGTENSGVILVHGATATALSTAQGLLHNNITQLISDNFGRLWFGSTGGIFYVDRSELTAFATGKIERLHAIPYGRDEDLKDLACVGEYHPRVWKTPAGKLWFATRRGVLVIHPEPDATPATPPPHLAIEEVRLNDESRAITRPFAVDASTRKLEIRFSALSLSSPEKLQLKYRLEGFDRDWINASPERVAAYPRLPAGEYQFQLAARSAESAAGEVRDSLLLVVAPVWWQTWWFRLTALALGAVGIAQAVRTWSHRRLRNRLEQAERERAIERERARIAQNIHDDVGASLTRISLLTQSARPATPTQDDQLNKIHEVTRDITRSLDEIVWAVNPRHDNLESFAAYVSSYAQNFLGVAGIRCRLDVPSLLPELATPSQFRHSLFLCCKEALNNIVKHARATEASLSIHVKDHELTISIQDNGQGWPLAPDAAPVSHGHGNGLRNLQQRMTEMGGRFVQGPGLQGRGAGLFFHLRFPPA